MKGHKHSNFGGKIKIVLKSDQFIWLESFQSGPDMKRIFYLPSRFVEIACQSAPFGILLQNRISKRKKFIYLASGHYHRVLIWSRFWWKDLLVIAENEGKQSEQVETYFWTSSPQISFKTYLSLAYEKVTPKTDPKRQYSAILKLGRKTSSV